MEKFLVRTYGRTELALLYNPHLSSDAAYRKLKEWIRRAPGLQARLQSINASNSRCYLPAQVKLIVEALGEP